MSVKAPHYLLFSESSREKDQGQWRFVLQPVQGGDPLEAGDAEPALAGERLELLAVVRGLEALEQPSRVTLVTPSKYVNRGITYGLPEWRSTGWQWEHFGEMVPVKNRDLWQRVDRALDIHRVECRTWRFDLPHTAGSSSIESPVPAPKRRPFAAGSARSQVRVKRRPISLRRRLRRVLIRCDRSTRSTYESLKLRIAQLGTQLLPQPWLD
jgi:ribonuclease HI